MNYGTKYELAAVNAFSFTTVQYKNGLNTDSWHVYWVHYGILMGGYHFNPPPYEPFYLNPKQNNFSNSTLLILTYLIATWHKAFFSYLYTYKFVNSIEDWWNFYREGLMFRYACGQFNGSPNIIPDGTLVGVFE